MTLLKFSDGIIIDTSGPLRALALHYGVYVVGHGYLIPCKDEEEADEVIKYYREKEGK